MNEYTIESFISYCDDMMIVEEGFKEGIEKVKAWLIKALVKLLDLLQAAVTKIDNLTLKKQLAPGPISQTIQQLIARCKSSLSKAKSLNDQNPQLAERLKQDVSDIREKYDNIIKDIRETVEKEKNKTGKFNDVRKKFLEKEGNFYEKRSDKISK